jgi:hypothetical protein
MAYTNWTAEKLTEVAKQFKRKIDFQNQYGGGYWAAKRLGIWDEISAHMETNHKRNIVYLAKVLDPDFENVYKVGISSDGRIMQRAYDNARKSGLDLQVIRFTKVNLDAGKIEKELLAIGTKIDQQTREKLGRFDGHTEYVFMAEEQIAKCHKTLDQYAI